MSDLSPGKIALILSHLSFEDPGTLGIVLERRGFILSVLEPAVFPIHTIDPVEPDLLVILGGPIGIYDAPLYPHLTEEFSFIERRLRANRPLVGICLGAQMMAHVLGARVYPSGFAEIGWAPLFLTQAGKETSLALLGDGQPMLHWHGDTFDMPGGVETLAGTSAIPNQSFLVGRSGLALQCHPEIRGDSFERWLIGHAFELASRKIDVNRLRKETREYAGDLEDRSDTFFARWLSENGL